MVAYFQYRVSKGVVCQPQRVLFPYTAEPGDCLWMSDGRSLRITERKQYQSLAELRAEMLRGDA